MSFFKHIRRMKNSLHQIIGHVYNVVLKNYSNILNHHVAALEMYNFHWYSKYSKFKELQSVLKRRFVKFGGFLFSLQNRTILQRQNCPLTTAVTSDRSKEAPLKPVCRTEEGHCWWTSAEHQTWPYPNSTWSCKMGTVKLRTAPFIQ